jgi:divalent metal cation (Fe/Co/Zn/Cd) transporter
LPIPFSTYCNVHVRLSTFGPVAFANYSTQVYAAVSSVSLSLIATGIDATFDFGSHIFLYWIHKKALLMNTNKWPVGGSRVETI